MQEWPIFVAFIQPISSIRTELALNMADGLKHFLGCNLLDVQSCS